jgi:hypothetical protein
MEIESIIKKNFIREPIISNTTTRENNNELPELIKFVIPPFNNHSEFDAKYNKIQFNLNSTNLLDPYSLYFECEIENPNKNYIQLDGSAHSLIDEISFYSDGFLVEQIKSYDFIHNLMFDLNLTLEERRLRHKNEGFGFNKYGTNEVKIAPDPKFKKYDDGVMLFNNHKNHSQVIQDIKLDTPLNAALTGSQFNSIYDKETIDSINSNNLSNLDLIGKIKSINDWDCVQNGQLCFKHESQNNKYKFRIPLMLRSIGFGQQLNCYKLIPLKLFNQITIVIKLNPDAFFVPFDIKEYDYLNLGSANQIDEYLLRYPDASNSYKVLNPQLYTEQYRFEDMVLEKYIGSVKDGGYLFDVIDYEIIDRIQMKMVPNINFNRNITRKDIKTIYIVWTNDLYTHSKFARKNARFNKGFTKVVFKQAGGHYPPNTIEVYNSLNTHGPENASFFYSEVCKTRSNSSLKNTVVSYRNWCLDFDMSHLVGLRDYCRKYNKSQGIVEFNGKYSDSFSFTNQEDTKKYLDLTRLLYAYNSTIDNRFRFIKQFGENRVCEELEIPTSKCVYAINFETGPYTGGKYRSGIETSQNIPFHIDMTRLLKPGEFNELWLKFDSNIFWTQTIIFEYYYTLQLTPEGKFEKF